MPMNHPFHFGVRPWPRTGLRALVFASACFSLVGVSHAAGKGKKPAQAPAPATAAPSAAPSAPAGPQEKQGVSHILGFLDWGANSADVVATIKKEIDTRYAEVLRELRDPLEIDKTLRRKADEYGRIEKTFVQFTGQRTGYESSLIAADFLPNNDEAMLRVDDADAQRYYFFKNDRLWKVVVAYSSTVSRQTPFPEFVKQVQDKYGRAIAAEWTTPKGGAKTLHASTWEDTLTRVVVEDRTEFFGTYCMKFLDKAVGVPLDQEREKNQPSKPQVENDASVDSVLNEITTQSGPSDDGIVDRLTGSEHAVDLAGNRPEYETGLNRGPAASPTYPADAPDAKGNKGKAKAKAKAKAPEKGAKGAKSGKTDDGSPAKPAAAPIIY